MTFEEFLKAMTKQMYVWRMADRNLNQKMLASRETRLARARRRMDDAVLARAQTIADERRCAAVAEIDNPKGGLVQARCEFQKGHDKVGPGLDDTRLSHVTAKRDWDHGAPSAGKWWMDDHTMTMQMGNADG